MKNDIKLIELPQPKLEFGGVGKFNNPRIGLTEAGPFDLRFGAAHREQIRVGFIGTKSEIHVAQSWFERMNVGVSAENGAPIHRLELAFGGFQAIYRSRLVFDDRYKVELDKNYRDFASAFRIKEDYKRFEAVVDIYKDAIYTLASLDIGRPDIVVCCINGEVSNTCWSVERKMSPYEKRSAQRIAKQQKTQQMDWIDLLEANAEDEEYLLSRDFRRAIKAHAMHFNLPIQLVMDDLFDDSKGQSVTEKCWNLSVGIYYKSGGIPWRMKSDGPETCFVGITFHHFKTNQRHLVRSSIAQAFSTEGEGFALKGQSVPWNKEQGRNVHLTETQAFDLGTQVLEEYEARNGGYPIKIVLHKTSKYDDDEVRGFQAAFRLVPVVELINLMPTSFRLVRYGAYPVNRGTVCTVNKSKTYLFTTGYMPELGTYPGPHIPAPTLLQSPSDADLVDAAKDIMGLTRMNWNSAGITGGVPVTLKFSSRVGGIMDEYGADEIPLSSFRYYM